MQIAESQLETGSMPQHIMLTTPDIANGSAILFTHGYGADSSGYYEFAEACTDQGTTCLAVDLIGHGKSGGKREDLRITDYLEGLVAAYDYVVSQPQVDSSRIGAVAGSFGAYLSVLLADERPLESLLLRVPALYPDGLRNMPRHGFDTDTVLHMEPRPENKALQIIQRFLGKVVLVSSENDEIIMSSTIEAYAKAIQRGEHIQMAGAKHVLDPPNREVFKNILLRWAQDL